MKIVLLAIVLLLALDLGYGALQAQKVKKEFAEYSHEQLATVTKAKDLKQTCPNDQKNSCVFSIVDLTFEDNQGKQNTTQITDMGLEKAKAGAQIPVLCNTAQWVCVPKQYVETRLSMWNNMWSVSAIKTLL